MLFSAFASVGAAGVLHREPAAADQTLIAKSADVRVMALGDSITAGVGAFGARAEDGGYRGALATLLAAHGYHVTFVGSRTDYSADITARAHEGWPGYVIRSFPSNPGPGQLYGAVTRNAIRAGSPDVILLMAGTNDLLRYEKHAAGYTLPNIVHSMDLLLGEIFDEKPAVRVIVAPVVASPFVDACAAAKFAGEAACGPPGAESLESLVSAYAKRGLRISMATNMLHAVPRDAEHFPDSIHPSGAGGYGDVAQAWFTAIGDVTDSAAQPPVAKH